MLIGICGSVCAGKSTVAQYLVEHHGFKHLGIEPERPSEDEETASTAEENGSATPPMSAPNGTSKRPEMTTTLSYRSAHSTRSNPSIQMFPDASSLLDFVTKHWRSRWVTDSITSLHILDAFSRRPFFLLISVDAPVTTRWARFQSRLSSPPLPSKPSSSRPSTFESFVAASDTHLYDPRTGHLALMSRASVRLVNTSPDIAHLFATLGKVDLLNPDRLRPGWDTYFMALASLAAQRSNCMKRRVGCVLVREKRVVATGYNGTPRNVRNCAEGGCGRCNSGESSGVGLATCLCLHAEENALLEAGRERIREGATLYCDTCPCLTCSIKIVQVGIEEVVYAQGYSMDVETAAVFREAGVRLRQFVPPANGLIHLEKMEMY